MRGIKKSLAELLLEDAELERCGFVGKKGELIEVSNIADDPANAFRIDPGLVVRYCEEGVVATWHTHPKGTPNLSGEDMRCFLSWPKLKHYIIGRRDGEVAVTEYRVTDGGFVLQS